MNSSLADSPSNQSREILSAHPGKSAQKIIPGLDGLRGVAILGVLGFHFSNESGFARIFKPFHVGWIGVDLFFVISGFLITGILLDARNAPKYFSNFYARRALRIFPLYYVFLLAMLLIYKISGNRIIPHLDRTVATWPWWVFYGANYLVARRGWIFPAMGLFWSLAVEEHFYLCWPTVIRFIRPRLLPWIIYALIAGSLALRCIAWRCGVRNSLFFYTLTPCRLEGLCIGAGLAVVYKNRGLESIRTWTRAFIILGTAGFVLAILWSWDTSFNGHKMSTFGFFFLDLMCGGIMATAVTAAQNAALQNSQRPNTGVLRQILLRAVYHSPPGGDRGGQPSAAYSASAISCVDPGAAHVCGTVHGYDDPSCPRKLESAGKARPDFEAIFRQIEGLYQAAVFGATMLSSNSR